MISSLGLDPTLYSLHSFRRGSTTTAYRAGVDALDIKRHGTWASECFWQYITAPIAAQSSMAAALAKSVSVVRNKG